MMDKALLFIVAALGLSTFVNLILKRLGLSLIIGYIFTGTFLVYALGLQEFRHSEALEGAAEFGIVFLMFTIGLEISLSKMNKMKRLIFVNGFLQVGLNSVVLFVFAYYLFHLSAVSALIIALAFALSSTAIVLTYLKSSKEIHTPYGQRAMGILIFQDLAVIPILILLGVLSNESAKPLSEILFDTGVSAILVLGFLFVLGKQLFTWLLHFSASAQTDELFMSSVLFIVIAASYFAHAMGFTYSLGAFVAGMIIAETRYYHKVEADIAPFKDILLGTFFILIGMQIELGVFAEHFLLVIGLFLGVLLVKTLVTFTALRFGDSTDTAFKTAVSLSQVGEFALVIFSLATASNLLDSKLASIAMLVVILSMVVTPFLIPYTQKFVALFVKDAHYIEEVEDIGAIKDHIIICGYGRVGQYVQHHLDMYGYEYIIVDNNPQLVKKAQDEGLKAYLGDMSKTAIIEALHAKDAAAIILTIESPEIKALISQKLLDISPDANIIVQIASAQERQALKDIKILNAVDGEIEIARILVERVMQCELSQKRKFD